MRKGKKGNGKKDKEREGNIERYRGDKSLRTGKVFPPEHPKKEIPINPTGKKTTADKHAYKLEKKPSCQNKC